MQKQTFQSKKYKEQYGAVQSKEVKVFKLNRISTKISLILSDRETVWNEKQDIKLKERLQLKLQKAEKAKDYTKKLLQDCKSWEGPSTTMDELRIV